GVVGDDPEVERGEEAGVVGDGDGEVDGPTLGGYGDAPGRGSRDGEVGRFPVEEQHPHRPGVEVAVVVPGRSDGELGDAVAVEVAERGQRAPEEVAVVEVAGESALRRGDLLVVADAAEGVEEED